jgi:hypothetical protein
VKRCKKSESLIHTCGFFHFTFEASSCMWISCTCGFAILDLKLSSCMWKNYKKSDSLIDACCFPFQIRSFSLYVKNSKSDIWYGTLQYVICIPLFFVCLLEHEVEKSDSLGSTHIIIEIRSVWLNFFGFVRSC